MIQTNYGLNNWSEVQKAIWEINEAVEEINNLVKKALALAGGFWSRNFANGYLYPTTPADNVSIEGNDLLLDDDRDSYIHTIADDQISIVAQAAQVVGIYNDVIGAQILLVDGSNAVPSYSFIADRDCGIYRIGANEMGFAANATLVAEVIGGAGENQIRLIDGTVTRPAYSFIADTNLGFYRTGIDTIGVAMGNALDFSFSPNSFDVLSGSSITMSDDTWIGLGAAAGRITFDITPLIDEITFYDCNVGIGAVPGAGIKHNIYTSQTNIADLIGQKIYCDNTATINGAYLTTALQIRTNAVCTANNGDALYGIDCTAYKTGGGNLSSIYALGFYYGNPNTATGGITSVAIGINISLSKRAATISSSYDIYINTPIAGGSVTNEWCIFSDHNAVSRFVGEIQVDSDVNGFVVGAGQDCRFLYNGTSTIFRTLLGSANYVFDGYTAVDTDTYLNIQAGEGFDAILDFNCDENDDAADTFRIRTVYNATSSSNLLKIQNDTNVNDTFLDLVTITAAGAVTISILGLGIVHSSAAGLLTSSAVINADLGNLGTAGTIPKFAATGLADSVMVENAGNIINGTGYFDSKTYYYINNIRIISVDGANNLMVGEDAGNGGVSTNGVHVGFRAGYSTLAAGTHAFNMGSNAGYSQTTAVGCVNIGSSAGYSNVSGNSIVNIGYLAGYSNIASYCVNIGTQAGELANNAAALFNTNVGFFSGRNNLAGTENTAVGAYAMRANLGSYATAIGMKALYNATLSTESVAVGDYALYSNLTGEYITAVGGGGVGYNSNASGGVFLGYAAGYFETGASKLFIDNAARTNEADGRIKALVYGIFAAAPANQLFRVNGECELYQDSLYWKFGAGGDVGITYDGTDTVFRTLVGNATYIFDGYTTVDTDCIVKIGGGEAKDAILDFICDEGDDAADKFRIRTVYNATSADNVLKIQCDNAVKDTFVSFINITTGGDLYFTEDGSGLPFGSCYGNEIAWTQAAAVQNTWYNISDTDMTDGHAGLNLVTHDGSGKLTVTLAGRYEIIYSIDLQSDTANQHILTGIELNGTGTAINDGQSHVEPKFVSEEEHAGNVAQVDLAAGGYFEIAVCCTDAGTPDITVSHLSVAVKMIGGT